MPTSMPPSPSARGTRPSAQSGSSYCEIWYAFGCPDRSSSCGRTSSARGSGSRARARRGSPGRTASPFGTGSIPGCARQTGQTFVFGGVAEAVRAAAEHLRARRELHVDLEADHRLPRHGCVRDGSPRAPRSRVRHRGRSRSPRSSAWPRGEQAVLGERRPDELEPDRQAVGRARTGSTGPAARPGSTGSVKTSSAYIASGSSSFAPSSNATRRRGRREQHVAARRRPSSKSRRISVRTRCAWP